MGKIYESGITYRIANWLVKRVLYLYYDEIIISGRENIPQDGPFIFAPNHRNALMDALAILLITPKGKSTSFLARSDIFRNKRVARFLHFAKIMPAFRIRDGYENLNKNNEVFDACRELLRENHTLCIMPEGNQEMEHRVRPLVKGIFRIAFSLNESEEGNANLSILPVGLDYGDIVKFGKHLIVEIGKPIQVSEYAESFSENPSKTINDIKADLKLSLEGLCLHIPSETHYDTILNTLQVVDADMLQHRNYNTNYVRFRSRIATANELDSRLISNPEGFSELSVLTNQYADNLRKYRIESRNVNAGKSSWLLIIQALGLLLTLPVAIVGFATNFLTFFAPVYIRKRMKIEYEGFFSSVQFVASLITFPVFYTVQAVITLLMFDLSGFNFLPVVMLFYLSGRFAFWYYCSIKKLIANVRFYSLPRNVQSELLNLKAQILRFARRF